VTTPVEDAAIAPTLRPLGLAAFARMASNGAAAAGIISLTMAWVGDQVPIERRQPVLASPLASTVTGMVAGQRLAGVFADTPGWRWGFGAGAWLFALAAMAFAPSHLLGRSAARCRRPGPSSRSSASAA
jgi:MFS family permease